LKHSHENIFLDELSTHWRFTLGAVIFSAILIFVFKQFSIIEPYHGDESLFETFFISHLFFAALTPASLLSKYRAVIWLGVIVAIITSSITCTLSDIIFPYLGGLLLGYDMHFHVCIIEEPVTAWTFIISGALLGFLLSPYVRKLSRVTHGLHIFLSSSAAGLYLVTYGVEVFSAITLLFIPILLISVLIPCVLNDIGVPSYIVTINPPAGKNRQDLLDEIHHDHHDHHH
jgi:hypothetical protein